MQSILGVPVYPAILLGSPLLTVSLCEQTHLLTSEQREEPYCTCSELAHDHVSEHQHLLRTLTPPLRSGSHGCAMPTVDDSSAVFSIPAGRKSIVPDLEFVCLLQCHAST